jgi:YfiH family protein
MILLDGLDVPGVAHGFFTREGGVSEGLYASLNCGLGSGDDAAHVVENRRRVAAALALEPGRLLTCHQIHSADVVVVDEPWSLAGRPRADAMVTKRAGIALGILTADCAPVLFVDPKAGIIGAAHAGWRGALTGVLDATVAAMRDLGAAAADIRAGIGPCIGQASYEVGPEFPAPFLAERATNERFFIAAARPGHFQFDLAAYVADRLRHLGLARVDATGGDTAAESERFFSYRRSCHNRESDYGREISAIAITGTDT